VAMAYMKFYFILFYFAEFLKKYQLFMLKISEAQSKLKNAIKSNRTQSLA
jgi:hypothetical protein